MFGIRFVREDSVKDRLPDGTGWISSGSMDDG